MKLYSLNIILNFNLMFKQKTYYAYFMNLNVFTQQTNLQIN